MQSFLKAEGIFEEDGKTPVSYTHLDVYKRQLAAVVGVDNTDIGDVYTNPENTVELDPIAVSYTHLDVYKSQTGYREETEQVETPFIRCQQ